MVFYRYVAPKKEKLDTALESLRQKQEELAEAKRKLEELYRQLEVLEKQYAIKLLEKEELERRALILKLKLERAYMLVDGLSGERERWTQKVITLDQDFVTLPGDCLLSTAFISYLGPFVSYYRDMLNKQWFDEVLIQLVYS